MAYDLNRLLEQDMLSMSLSSGSFDVEQLADEFSKFNFCLRDVLDQTMKNLSKISSELKPITSKVNIVPTGRPTPGL